jgi:hypothetical protein
MKLTLNESIPGSVVASLQSILGNVGAHSVFASLQSAAMGGYGVATVNGTMQACVIILQTALYGAFKLASRVFR